MLRGAAAIAFYTCLPVPADWPLEFRGIARYAPLVGLAIGGLLAAGDGLLAAAQMPVLTRSALIVASWLALTGGLHLDGAMDAADGLAVQDPQRRLDVMADSRTGAFGAMAAVIILGLKTLALAELAQGRWLVLMAVAGWGRWGQVVAIGCYPYLRPAGKGAFHKPHLRLPWDLLPSSGALLALSGLYLRLNPAQWPLGVGLVLGGIAITTLTGAWFNRQLGGHTGDTYGAIVEWTEALLLCLATVVQ
ncbi:adenosylcobinamide-GDP ribazoletransferase [Pseudanabaena sp. FACHB-2040]|uniref:adenosylcobinamide-GDP ribazoletransferase n=1 Tax=Pseudanabaena sp. FACHB-2040 TaxID=2692859 RepID=UPI0016866062|nr:adenosylcobinamide-GDP ribazoletransferase [Pseudanabaena sp. FACHB-2040]MBD2257910.1 adenosylcobinamide-GDP ribazoletransferase [Pseudanabaena sp. FACHB-2040]